MPGFPKALARTIHELRLAGVGPDSSRQRHRTRRRATSAVCSRVSRRSSIASASTIGRRSSASPPPRSATATFAGRACRSCSWTCRSTRRRSRSSSRRSPAARRTCSRPFPTATWSTAAALAALGAELDRRPDDARESTDSVPSAASRVLERAAAATRTRRRRSAVFGARRRARGRRDRPADPGRGRSRRAVRRDGRLSAHAAALSRTARARLRACRVPAYFDRGIRRPDPAGRAFIALLSCAVEGLSARRFDEYLSLGQVPRVRRVDSPSQPSHESEPRVVPRDELFASDGDNEVEPESPEDIAEASGAGSRFRRRGRRRRNAPVAVEVGRARRRVGGRRRTHARRRQGSGGGGASTASPPTIACASTAAEARGTGVRAHPRFERDLKNLRHLRDFALPIVDDMAAWPDRANWGEWLDRAERAGRPRAAAARLACSRRWRRCARWPRSVRCAIEEVRDVLRDRLVMLDWEPRHRRYGRVFVGTPHQARGRTLQGRLRAGARRARRAAASARGSAAARRSAAAVDERSRRVRTIARTPSGCC